MTGVTVTNIRMGSIIADTRLEFDQTALVNNGSSISQVTEQIKTGLRHKNVSIPLTNLTGEARTAVINDDALDEELEENKNLQELGDTLDAIGRPGSCSTDMEEACGVHECLGYGLCRFRCYGYECNKGTCLVTSGGNSTTEHGVTCRCQDRYGGSHCQHDLVMYVATAGAALLAVILVLVVAVCCLARRNRLTKSFYFDGYLDDQSVPLSRISIGDLGGNGRVTESTMDETTWSEGGSTRRNSEAAPPPYSTRYTGHDATAAIETK